MIDIDRHGAEARALPRSLRTYLESSATRCTVLSYMRNGPRASKASVGPIPYARPQGHCTPP